MKIPILLIPTIVLLAACNQQNSSQTEKQADTAGQATDNGRQDSLDQIGLLKSVYHWHLAKGAQWNDFDIIVKDTIQIGLNYDSFYKRFAEIKQTGFFSPSFIDNYKKIGDFVDHKLTTANPKLPNEINFSFQDADPWTFFQDDAGNYWEKFTIKDYKRSSNTASLKWVLTINDISSEGYTVGFSKENGKWKVSYLEGFDLKRIE